MISNVVDLQGFLHYRGSMTLFAPVGFIKIYHLNLNIKNMAFQPLPLKCLCQELVGETPNRGVIKRPTFHFFMSSGYTM